MAEGCLSWIDRYGDGDGDGFQEYERRTGDGAEKPVRGPKAVCELQRFMFTTQGWKDAGNAVLDGTMGLSRGAGGGRYNDLDDLRRPTSCGEGLGRTPRRMRSPWVRQAATLEQEGEDR